MASEHQTQPQLGFSSPTSSHFENKRKRQESQTMKHALASFGGYAADEEADANPSSQVNSAKSKKKKKKKHKIHKTQKRRHSEIVGGNDDEEDIASQVPGASLPFRKRKNATNEATLSGDEVSDRERINVTPTPPAKRRRKSGGSKKADRRKAGSDGYDATTEEESAAEDTEKKASLIDTVKRPGTLIQEKTPSAEEDSGNGDGQRAETPIRPPPRIHGSNSTQSLIAIKHESPKKLPKKATRKAKAPLPSHVTEHAGRAGIASSMRKQLSNISDDMFAKPIPRRVAFEPLPVKAKSSLQTRRREAVDDEWEETIGKVRGLVIGSGDAEMEENIAYSTVYLESAPERTITYGDSTCRILMLSAGDTRDIKAEKGGVVLCEVTKGGPLLVVVTDNNRQDGKSFRINEGGLWRVRGAEDCHVTNIAGEEVRLTIFGKEHQD
ncbi:hypothetical protein HYFRA_00010855 [Hymenoscyphus fraxineus]|uniref:Uncharacterized protein n=1 Tax=Hymenoscyphus fraxineus TaxID=746836 RepID=A0A9N9KU11_9HELO|nr:hypothetical protein HYFRA_00010855 [Hymenoscyphus fraxineus]